MGRVMGYELRQEGQEEHRQLGIEDVDQEAPVTAGDRRFSPRAIRCLQIHRTTVFQGLPGQIQ
jgi:hypothetical protein